MVASRRPLLVAVIAAVTASALVVGVSAAGAAKGGNSENAKLCQKGGWQDLVGSQSQSFASEEECVSHAAEGGTLSPEPTLMDEWREICEAGGGTFEDFGFVSPPWACNATGIGLSQATMDALQPVCTEAGGITRGNPSSEPYSTISCDPS